MLLRRLVFIFSLLGAEDERDNVPVAESVRRLEHAFRSAAKTNYEIVVIPGAGHGFLDQQRKLMAEFVERLRGWVEQMVKAQPSAP